MKKYKNAYRTWKSSEQNKLIRMWKDGMTIDEIGKILKRPNSGIYQRIAYLIRRHKIKKRYPKIENQPLRYKTWTKSDVKQLKELVSKGRNNSDIGDIMNRSPHSIKSKVKKLKLRMDNNIVIKKRGRGRPRKVNMLKDFEDTNDTDSKDELIELLESIIEFRQNKELTSDTTDRLCYAYICAIKETMERSF